MNWELYIGLAGFIAWGIVCSVYVWRDQAVRLVMVLPFVVFIALIVNGLGR